MTSHHHQSINHKTADVTDKRGNQQSIFSYRCGKAHNSKAKEVDESPLLRGGRVKTLIFRNIKRPDQLYKGWTAISQIC